MIALLTSLIFSKTFAVIAVLATAIHFYCKRKYSYWDKRGVDGPNIGLFGGLFTFLIKPIYQIEEERYAKYGKIHGSFEGLRPVLKLAEPELIKNVLVKDFHLFVNRRKEKFNDAGFDDALFAVFDDHWKRLRSVISPTFSSGKMKKMYPLVEDCVDSCMEVLEKAARKGSEIEMKSCFGNLTMDVIGRCAFATKLNTHENEKHPFVENAKKVFHLHPIRMLLFLLPSSIRKTLNVGFIDPSATAFFQKVIDKLKKERAKTVSKKGAVDFLHLMLDSQKNNNVADDEDEDDEIQNEIVNRHENGSVKSMKSKVNEEPLTDSEVFANCFTFFFAGYETTASLLSYFIYAVTINPECQKRLYEEIKDAADEKGRFSYEKLSTLEYLDACINETSRLYNVVLAIERTPSEDYKLGDTGIVVEKETIIQIPVHAIHHSDEFYPESNRFIPERWLPENRDKLVPYTFLPFGGGPRNCVGMRFALMEAKLAIAKIIKEYEFVRCSKTKVPLEFRPRVFMLQAKEITVKVLRRN